MRRIRGLKSLVHDAIDKTVDLVSVGHESTARTVIRMTDQLPGIEERARRINAIRELGTRGVLGTIKLSNRAIQKATDLALDVAVKTPESAQEAPVPMRSDAMAREGLKARWAKDAALAVVNAAVGDRLHEDGNGLALDMQMRVGDSYVDPRAFDWKGMRRVAIFVHGLGTTEWSWCLESAAYHGDAGANFGTLLKRDLSIVPIFIRYNTGRHVSANGRQLAQMLETLSEAATDLDELILIGHSMGGLVIRSACHYGAHEQHWVARTKRVFCLGSPHRGAPLEKFGNIVTGVLGAIDLPGSLIVARILEGRSVGIKDLRHGALVDEDWLGKDPDALLDEGRVDVPLLPHIRYHFVSATMTQDPEHPIGRLMGDILVREVSACGPQRAASTTTEIESLVIETARFGGVLHHQLQNHPGIYEVVRKACATEGLA